jgi:ribosomal protein L13
MIDTDAYEKMTWETPSDELEDAVENLLAEVKRLREVIKKIKACATINAQHDDTLNEEWEYILELIE